MVEITGFQTEVIRKLNAIDKRVKQLQLSFSVLLTKETASQEDIEDIVRPRMELFPITSENSLQNVEDILTDVAEMNVMARQLSLIGGTSVKEVTKKIMYRIINNDMGSKFSWEGQKGKRKFKDLKLALLVLKTVRLNFKDSTEAEIVTNIKEWLVRAKFREIRKIAPNSSVPV